ncbi:MAG: cupredoxin domain-containing protein [Actinomycetota bacterium]
MARTRTYPAACVAILLLAACGGGGSEAGTTQAAGAGDDESALTVTADDLSFQPDHLKAEPGTEVTVRFANEDDTRHTFTIEDLDVDVQADPGVTEEVSFTTPDDGEVSFNCTIHPAMKGTISLDGAGADGDESDSDSDSRGGYDY